MTYPYNKILPGLKKIGVLTHVTTSMNLENTMVREKSQSEKNTVVLFIGTVRNKDIHRYRKQISSCLEQWGVEGGSSGE